MAEILRGVNGSRIQWCCDEAHITVPELARETGIPENKISRTVAGDSCLTLRQLTSIANYFGRGLLFFVEEGPVKAEVIHTPAFRTIANRKPQLSTRLRKLIENAERQRETYESLLEDAVEPPQVFNPPQLSRRNLQAAAQITREWLELDFQSSFGDYRKAVEDKGILVFRSNGYAGKWQISKQSPILGFSLYDEQYPLIVVKKARHETREVFTLFHELAHILLHKESWIDDANDFASETGKEAEANRFAGLVLITTQALQTISDEVRPDNYEEFATWLTPVSRRFGVSTEVVLRRLLEEGRLPRSIYSEYREWITEHQSDDEIEEGGGSRAYRHREPIHIFGDRFVRTVLDALESNKITLVKASKYLDGLKLEDLRTLNKYYADL